MSGPVDALGWAKRPRSREAIAAVVRLAGREARFRDILAGLVRAGVVSGQGAPLAVWDGGAWRRLRG